MPLRRTIMSTSSTNDHAHDGHTHPHVHEKGVEDIHEHKHLAVRLEPARADVGSARGPPAPCQHVAAGVSVPVLVRDGAVRVRVGVNVVAVAVEVLMAARRSVRVVRARAVVVGMKLVGFRLRFVVL